MNAELTKFIISHFPPSIIVSIICIIMYHKFFIKASIDTSNQALKNANLALDGFKQLNNEYRTDNTELKKDIKILKEQNDDLNASIKNQEIILKKIKNELELSFDRFDDISNRILSIFNAYESFKHNINDIASLNNKLNNCFHDLEEMKKSIENIYKKDMIIQN